MNLENSLKQGSGIVRCRIRKDAFGTPVFFLLSVPNDGKGIRDLSDNCKVMGYEDECQAKIIL